MGRDVAWTAYSTGNSLPDASASQRKSQFLFFLPNKQSRKPLVLVTYTSPLSEHDAERGRARCSEPRQQPPEWGGSCSGKPKGECSHSDPTTLATEAARFTWACVTILQGLAVCLVDLVERMMCFPSQFTPTARFWQIPMYLGLYNQMQVEKCTCKRSGRSACQWRTW